MIDLTFWTVVPALFVLVVAILVSAAFGSLRAGVAILVAAWIVVAAVWAQHWIVSARPAHNEGPGAWLGLILFTMVTLGVGIGTVAFAFVAAWWTKKR